MPLKVESIADEKLVIQLKTPVLEREFDEPELRTVQQRTDRYGSGFAIFQGLNARYYFVRTARIRDYVRDTPPWVLDLQRSAVID